MLDRSKAAPRFVVHRVWVPKTGEQFGRRAVAYVTERKRRVIGGRLIVLALILTIVLLVSHAESWWYLVATVFIVGGGSYALGGDSGFYEIAGDGSLGEDLGKTWPDVRGMRGMRARSWPSHG